MSDWIHSLPLEQLAEWFAGVVFWWNQLTQGIPSDRLAVLAYAGGVTLALLLWLLVARVLPRPWGGISWVMVFAILVTPSFALGDTGALAPACVGVVYGLLLQDWPVFFKSLMPILLVMGVCLLIGFIWQRLKRLFVEQTTRTASA